MRRLAWSQLRFRSARLVALLAGMLLATTAFTVLTAASRTSQLRTIGTVSAHFVPAYDILVRPKGARTSLEQQTNTVQPNFLSGIYGGITMAQYHEIQRIPGVQVAAPIAMVGYTLLGDVIGFSVPATDYDRTGRQLYRITTTWVSDAGTSRIVQPPAYRYVTPNPLNFNIHTGGTDEGLPGGARATVCPIIPHGPNPFGVSEQSTIGCWSKVDQLGDQQLQLDLGPRPDYDVYWVIPVLIAAIDPAAEAKLDGLNRAVVSGHYLAENAGDGSLPVDESLSASGPPPVDASFPVLASSASGMDEYALTRLEALASPAAPPLMNLSWVTREAAAPGRALVTERTTAQQAYRSLLAMMAAKPPSNENVLPADNVEGYWSVGPVTYRRSAGGALTPLIVHNPPSVWFSDKSSIASMDNEDKQYRVLTLHSGPLASPTPSAIPKLVGVFDPGRIRSFDPLSEVPLGSYQPVRAAAASAASRRALRGGDLQPNQNLGGYVSQPVDLVTTLSALPALENSGLYGRGLPSSDPISVIRLRVAGVTGPNALTLARIREVAQQIETKTQLDVDIVAGSSPAPTTIDLPAGKFGQPPLTLTEDWVKKGVALAILSAVDKDSLVLFTLVLVVCVLFVANSASAAIRGRRRELGVLACLGWTRPRLFAAVLGELAAIGLGAGILGAAAALPLSPALGLHASPQRAALAVPVAVGVAVISGLVPAWLAARAEPLASVRPPVLAVRRARAPGGITALAAVNVLRTPGRAAVSAVSLAIGITALTMLAAVTFAFRGDVVGSLLGNAVAIQVRGVDYVAAIATIALGVLAVADVVFISTSERAAELAVIRALGWRESDLSRLVVTEGTIIGLAGSLAGAALGLAAAAKFAGQLPGALYVIAAGAAAAGVLVTVVAALLPAQALRRLPAAHLLAQD